MRPMRYHLANSYDLERMLSSDQYAVEPKLDGIRCLVCVDDGKAQLLNSSGAKLSAGSTNWHRPRLIAEFQREFSEGHWIFDGELMPDGKLWLFDLVEANGVITRKSPYQSRRQALEFVAQKKGWGQDGLLNIVSHATTEQDKRTMLSNITAGVGEGIMLKRLSSTYSETRVTHSLKWKLTKTVDAIVHRRNVDGKCNAEVKLLLDGRDVHIGSVSMHGREDVQVGGVIEIEFLYVSESGKLVQPRMIKARHDKAPSDCTIDQLYGLTVNKETATMGVLV